MYVAGQLRQGGRMSPPAQRTAAAARSPTTAHTVNRISTSCSVLLVSAGRRAAPPGVPFLDEPVELRIVQVDDVDPQLEHVVDAALAESGPHCRIRVPAIRRRVVVDADDMQH